MGPTVAKKPINSCSDGFPLTLYHLINHSSINFAYKWPHLDFKRGVIDLLLWNWRLALAGRRESEYVARSDPLVRGWLRQGVKIDSVKSSFSSVFYYNCSGPWGAPQGPEGGCWGCPRRGWTPDPLCRHESGSTAILSRPPWGKEFSRVNSQNRFDQCFPKG